jgi:tetratricopeptide (TPR) repeat protein
MNRKFQGGLGLGWVHILLLSAAVLFTPTLAHAVTEFAAPSILAPPNELDPSGAVSEMLGDGRTLDLIDRALGASTLSPDYEAELRLMRGSILLDFGACADAIAELDTVLELTPDDDEALAKRGLAYLCLDRYELAGSDLNAAVALDGESFWGRFGRGWLYFRVGRLGAAEDDFDVVTQVAPQSVLGFWARGYVRLTARNYEDSIFDFDQALQLGGESASSYLLRGYAFLGIGQRERAVGDFDTALTYDISEPATYIGRGFAHLKLGDVGNAEEDFSAAVGLDPASALAQEGLGLVLNERREFERALESFAIAIDGKPRVDTHFGRGVARMETGDIEGAVSDFEEALQISPDYAGTYVNLGIAQTRGGDDEQALTSDGART